MLKAKYGRFFSTIWATLLLSCLFAFAMTGTGRAAEALKKVRIAFPSMVIDFAPLWVAGEKGLFRDEGLDVENMLIPGGVRGIQALIAGDTQFALGNTAYAVAARAAGEGIFAAAVPMNRLDYLLVARQPVARASDFTGKKVAVGGGVGGADSLAARIALERLGVNPSTVTMIAAGGSGERLNALRAGAVDAAIIGGGTFIGGGSGLHKIVDLTELGIEYPMTGLFTMRKYSGGNRDSILALIRGYLRGVKFFQERKDEAIAITARNLRSTNLELIERQWQYAKSYMFEKIPYPTEKGFKAVIDLLAPRNPKVASLRFEDVADTGYVRELVDKGFFK
jgi:ABC-type nitrate/sulfonate/bicarbonate transport system substrate-binding protein